jgi:hypothetical protein
MKIVSISVVALALLALALFALVVLLPTSSRAQQEPVGCDPGPGPQ